MEQIFLTDYRDNRKAPSGFYYFILTNDLYSAVKIGTSTEINELKEIIHFINANLEKNIYGSVAKVEAHCAHEREKLLRTYSGV